MFVLLILAVVALLCAYIYKSFRDSYETWQRCGVVNIKPKIPYGNFRNMVVNKTHFGVECRHLYEQLKHARTGFAGIYLFKRPCLFVVGPESAKLVLARDFATFMNRGVYYNPKDDPLSANIFFHEGAEWKALRQRLSFAFTSGKMKTMFGTLASVGSNLVDYIANSGEVLEASVVDMKDLMARFTTDVISSCVFGIEGDCIRNPESEFRYYGKKVMTFSAFQNIATGLASTFREVFRRIGFKMFDSESTAFFYDLVKQTIEMRRERNIERQDLMQILISMMQEGSEDKDGGDKVLNLNDVAANAFIFFFAGFDTSSTTLAVALYYLALNPEIQDRARQKIKHHFDKDKELTYENINEIQIIECIILETLRMFPPVATLHRISGERYDLPDGQHIDEGTMVIRICIGQRFAMMQTKFGLISILRHFRVSVCDETEIPLKIDFSQVTYTPLSIQLKMSKIDE